MADLTDVRCVGCRYWEQFSDNVGPLYGMSGFGHCIRWHQHYGVNRAAIALNEAWVESDEGWANVTGPDFGCVLFEPKEPSN